MIVTSINWTLSTFAEQLLHADTVVSSYTHNNYPSDLSTDFIGEELRYRKFQ